jgi:hypothetical protein
MRLLGFVLLATLAAPLLGPQEPEASPFAGSWSGSGRFTTDAAQTPCRYEGALQPPSVAIELEEKGGIWSGQVILDLPSPPQTTCPPIQARYKVLGARLSGNSLAFDDASGNQWALTLRRERLRGSVASPSFSGEVDLGRGKSVAPRGGGSAWGGIATAVGTGALGAGAFLGVNRLLQDSGQGTGSTPACSPRTCVTGAPGEPCLCNTNISNGVCPGTTAGIPVNGACNPPSLPCQSELSCNNGLCEDRAFGRCPF